MQPTTLWHIADLHIHRGKHNRIKHGFNQLIVLIENEFINFPERTQFLIIAGDVFEYKTSYSQVDIECFHYLLNLTQQYPKLITISIPGNHDYSAANDLDLIRAVLEKTTYKNVFHYYQSGVYTHENIDFYVYSPMDKGIPELTQSTNFKVALIHEPIAGCEIYDGFKLDGRFIASDLSKKFNITMLGDIHKHQELAKNLAYCGSFVQNKKSEDENHGTIKWTVLNGKVSKQFIVLDQIETHVVIYCKNNTSTRYNLTHITNPRYVEISHSNCSEKYINAGKKMLETRLKMPVHLTSTNVIDKYNKTIKSSSSESSVNSLLDVQLNMIKEVLVDRKQAQYYEAVKQLHLQYVDVKLSRPKWELLELTWSNVFRYGPNNKIDFEKINNSNVKIIPLIGKNATGKSSILDILICILYNIITRGTHKTIIRNGENAYHIKCKFRIGSVKYEIERTQDRARHSNCKLLQEYDGVITDISGCSITDTYDKMRKLIGTYTELLNINIATQGCIPIINAPKQKDRLLQFLEIDQLNAIAETIRKEFGKIASSIKEKQECLPNIKWVERKNYEQLINDAQTQLESITSLIEVKTKLTTSYMLTEVDNDNLEITTNKINECEEYLQHFIDINPTQDINTLKKLIQELKNTIEVNKCKKQTVDISKDSILEQLKTVNTQFLQLQTTESLNDLQSKLVSLSSQIYNVDQETVKKVLAMDKTFVQFNIVELNDKAESSKKEINTLTKQLSTYSFHTIPEKYKISKQNLEEIASTQLNFDVTKLNKLENAIDKIRQQLSELPSNMTLIKRTDLEQKDLEIDTNLIDAFLINVDPVHLIKPTPPIIPEKFNMLKKKTILETETKVYEKIQELKLLITNKEKLSKIDPDTKSLFTFSKECKCCNDNLKLLTNNNLDTSELTHYALLVAYYKELIQYKTATAKHHSAVESDTRNKKVKLTANCINDKKYYEMLNKLELRSTLAKELSSKITELKILQDKYDMYKDIKDVIVQLAANAQTNSEIKTINKRLLELETFVSNARLDIQKQTEYETLMNIRHQLLHNKKINAEKKVVSDMITLVKTKEQLATRIIEIKQQIVTIDNNETLDTQIAADLAKLHDLEHSKKILSVRRHLAALKSNADAINHNEQVKQTLKHISEEIKALFNSRKPIESTITKYTSNKLLLEEYDRINAQIALLQEKLDIYKIYHSTIALNSGVSDQLLKKYVTILQHNVNAILQSVTDFTIVFDTTSGKKNQEEKADLKFISIVHNGKKISAKQGSGFQKFIIDTAIRLTVASLNHSAPKFMIIDEGFGCMDQEHLSNVREFLQELQHSTIKLDWVLIISHIEELNTISATALKIQSTDGISSINF